MLAAKGTAAPTPAAAPTDRSGDHQIAPRLVHFFLIAHGDGLCRGGARKRAILPSGSGQCPRFRALSA